tara:strand:+ start:598 stop:1527 length:930 start_codon:yes stop_codon:yes gene_type:complete
MSGFDSADWRGGSNFKSSQETVEKEFMNVAKKVRAIMKLENQAHIEENQKAKLAGKQALLDELCEIEVGPRFWEERYEDVYAELDQKQRSRVDTRKSQKVAEEKRKQEDREQYKREQRIDPMKERRRDIEMKFVPRHERPVTDLCWDPPRYEVQVGEGEKKIVASGDELEAAIGRKAKIGDDMTPIPERKGWLYSTSKDKYIVRWDIHPYEGPCKAAATLCGHEGSVWCIDIARDAGVLVSGGADGLLCYWDANHHERNSKKAAFGQDRMENVLTDGTSFGLIFSGTNTNHRALSYPASPWNPHMSNQI